MPRTRPARVGNIVPDLKRLAFPVERLKPLPGNPRRGDVQSVVRSYSRFGQRKPVVARREGDDATVIAGNTQLAAAQELEWTHLAVVHVEDDDVTAKAFALADNRTSDLGTYDDPDLLAMLQTVERADADLLAATSFGDDDLAALIASLDEPEDAGRDTEPGDRPANPVTKPGDLIRLGKHRLLCGDSTDPATVRALLKRERPDLLVTDPPYGVAYASIGRTSKQHKPIANDALTPAQTRDLFAHTLAASRLKRGASFYATVPAGPLLLEFMEAVETGLGRGSIRQVLTWVKDRMVLGRGDYHYQHEPILYGWVPGAKHHFTPDRTQTSVWQIDRPRRSDEHPTMKPVELFERAVSNSSLPGQVVLDCFGGSGTSLIACENLERRARVLELDPGYCDVMIDRWQQHTGGKVKVTRG